MKVDDNKGQGSVEYILLMLVVVAMSYAVFSNDKFKDFFGKNSSILIALRDRMEYAYTYCTNTKDVTSGAVNYSGKHDSYYNTQTSNTHFFSASEKYPN